MADSSAPPQIFIVEASARTELFRCLEILIAGELEAEQLRQMLLVRGVSAPLAVEALAGCAGRVRFCTGIAPRVFDDELLATAADWPVSASVAGLVHLLGEGRVDVGADTGAPPRRSWGAAEVGTLLRPREAAPASARLALSVPTAEVRTLLARLLAVELAAFADLLARVSRLGRLHALSAEAAHATLARPVGAVVVVGAAGMHPPPISAAALGVALCLRPAELRALVGRLDADGDGAVSLGDLSAALPGLGAGAEGASACGWVDTGGARRLSRCAHGLQDLQSLALSDSGLESAAARLATAAAVGGGGSGAALAACAEYRLYPVRVLGIDDACRPGGAGPVDALARRPRVLKSSPLDGQCALAVDADSAAADGVWCEATVHAHAAEQALAELLHAAARRSNALAVPGRTEMPVRPRRDWSLEFKIERAAESTCGAELECEPPQLLRAASPARLLSPPPSPTRLPSHSPLRDAAGTVLQQRWSDADSEHAFAHAHTHTHTHAHMNTQTQQQRQEVNDGSSGSAHTQPVTRTRDDSSLDSLLGGAPLLLPVPPSEAAAEATAARRVRAHARADASALEDARQLQFALEMDGCAHVLSTSNSNSNDAVAAADGDGGADADAHTQLRRESSDNSQADLAEAGSTASACASSAGTRRGSRAVPGREAQLAKAAAGGGRVSAGAGAGHAAAVGFISSRRISLPQLGGKADATLSRTAADVRAYGEAALHGGPAAFGGGRRRASVGSGAPAHGVRLVGEALADAHGDRLARHEDGDYVDDGTRGGDESGVERLDSRGLDALVSSALTHKRSGQRSLAQQRWSCK